MEYKEFENLIISKNIKGQINIPQMYEKFKYLSYNEINDLIQKMERTINQDNDQEDGEEIFNAKNVSYFENFKKYGITSIKICDEISVAIWNCVKATEHTNTYKLKCGNISIEKINQIYAKTNKIFNRNYFKANLKLLKGNIVEYKDEFNSISALMFPLFVDKLINLLKCKSYLELVIFPIANEYILAGNCTDPESMYSIGIKGIEYYELYFQQKRDVLNYPIICSQFNKINEINSNFESPIYYSKYTHFKKFNSDSYLNDSSLNIKYYAVPANKNEIQLMNETIKHKKFKDIKLNLENINNNSNYYLKICYFCKKFNLKMDFNCSSCLTIKYCSKNCMIKDSQYHTNVCKAEFDYIKNTDTMEEFHLLFDYPKYDIELNDWSELQEYLNKIDTKKFYNVNFPKLTVALSFPLTFISCLRKFYKFISYNLFTSLKIHFIGTNILDFDCYKLMYSHIAKYYSDIQIDILLVGPNIDSKNDNFKDYVLPKNYKISYRKEYYHDIITDRNFIKPDVICIFHPGYRETWKDTFYYAISNNIPTIVSGFHLDDISSDFKNMYNDDLYPNIVFEDVNNFRMIINEYRIPEDFLYKFNDSDKIISRYNDTHHKLSNQDQIEHLEKSFNNFLKDSEYNKYIYGFIGSIQNSEKFKELGNNEFKNGNYTKAIDLYSKSITYNNQNHVYYSNRSICYYKINKFDLAYEDAAKAIEIEPSHLKSHVKRIESCLGLLNYKNAEKYYLEAVKIFPNENEILKLKVKISNKIESKKDKEVDLINAFKKFSNNLDKLI